MKKTLIPFIISLALLSGCTVKLEQEVETASSSQQITAVMTAEEEDLRNHIYTDVSNPGNRLSFTDTDLIIELDSTLENISPSSKPEDLSSGTKEEKRITNVNIEVEADTYYLSDEEDFSMRLTKKGPRIIVDEEGNEYFTTQQ